MPVPVPATLASEPAKAAVALAAPAPAEAPEQPRLRPPRPISSQLKRRRVVVAVVGVALVVAGFSLLRGNGFGLRSGGGAGCSADTKSDKDDGPGRNHVDNPTYNVDPPAGGNHLAQAARPGAYGVDYLPADGEIVKALEQGYVVLWYRPDLKLDGLAALQDLAFRNGRDVLTVPRASLSRPVAATAWHARLLCGSVDLPKLERFITTHVNKGPEKVVH